jgi:hypothetical protein
VAAIPSGLSLTSLRIIKKVPEKNWAYHPTLKGFKWNGQDAKVTEN